MNIIIIIVGLISILGADFGPNINVSEGLGTLNKRPDIAVDINNIIHVVWINADNNANVYYARSEDHGNTFSAPVQVNSVDGYAIEITYSGPKIESVGNTIHIIWADERNGYDETNIYYSRSLDGGDTWTVEIPIGDNLKFNLYPEISTSDNGNIHVIYYSYGRRFLDFQNIFHLSSADTGQSFNDDEIVNNYSGAIPCECCPADILVLNDGRKMVGFRDDYENIRDTYAMFSDPDTTVWENLTRISFDEFEIDYCPSSGPGMSRLGDKVGIAYMAAVNNYPKVFLKISQDDGSSFSDSIIVDPSAASDVRQDHPQTAITAGNWLHVVWEDQRGGYDIYYGGMNTGSNELTNIQVLNDDGVDANQKQPRIVDDGDFVYVIWADYRSDGHIYFTTNYDPTSGLDNELLPSNFIVKGMYPNPFNSNLAIEFSLQQESTIKLTALDILGRVVDLRELGIYSPGTHQISWNGKDHVAGVYFMQVTAGHKTHVQKVLYLK